MVDGWFFIFFGVVLAFAALLPAIGRVRRNFLFGIRLEPLMRSERAWREGHRASARVFVPAACVLLAYGTCMITTWPAWISDISLDLLRSIGIAILLGGLIWGTLRAVSAAAQHEPTRGVRRH